MSDNGNDKAGREPEPRTFSGRDTSQGHIVLRRPWQRRVFILGLAGLVVLGALLAWFA